MTEQIDGVSFHFEECGAGNSRVLLLHGWGCDISLMRPLAQRLQAQHRLLVPDFPGHGQSGRPPEPWGVPEYAAALNELLGRRDFLPCAVIAHSFGCRVAAWLAAQEDSRFTKMIFTGAAGIRKPQTEEGKKRAEHYQQLKKVYGAMRKTVVLAPLADALGEKARQKYGSRDYNALDEEMRKTFVKVINLDLSDLYPRIQAPTLLMWGTQDTETPLWMGRKMEELIPDAGLVELEGGTHFAYLEQLDRFCLIAEQFLKE